MKNKLNIGLAFSGGGYRAAAFNLGVLTYLEHIKLDDQSVLDKVTALSTVSGGTITGACYAMGKKRGEHIDDIYQGLYKFMSEVDLVALGIERLVSEKDWAPGRVKSLITAFADIYDRELFHNGRFGELMDDDPSFHLRHMSFNATEFSKALQFRFQWSEKVVVPRLNEPLRGIIGNYYYQTPVGIAKDIRMADILAASSCFPGGFEPINFPDDFVFPETPALLEFKKDEEHHISLMDGGIVDNQGIEPVLLADERMQRNQKDTNPQVPPDVHSLDLIIVSDVSSPYMEEFTSSIQKHMTWWRKLTPIKVIVINSIVCILGALGLSFSIVRNFNGLIILFTSILTLNLLIFVLASSILSVPKKFSILKPFLKPLSKLLRLKFLVYENLLMNRAKSVMKLTGEIFLKHVRRLNYQKVFADDTWKNRRIMNAIYELKPGEEQLKNKIKQGKIRPQLVPTREIQEVAKKAAGMPTTLWFTKEELEKQHMLDAIIACGQFNLCWNLLEYIDKIKRDPTNTNENHQLFVACEDSILSDWENFQVNPFWMVDGFKERMNIR
jgi:predicted acylesterase/phospholipase RssA